MKEHFNITVLVFICLFGFFSCDLEEKGFFFDEKTFNSNWTKWRDKDIQNYSFTMNGELPHWNFSRAILMRKYEVNIVVKNGVMDSFEYIEDNVPHEEEDGDVILEPEFTSISDMYQKISDLAEYEKEWWNEYSGNGHIISTEFKMKYDSESHYITFFEPVSRWKPNVIVDTTAHAVIISNFKILD